MVAVFHLAAAGAAPMLEAAYLSEQSAAASHDVTVRAEARDSHDASTCLVCSLLNTPAQIDVERATAFVVVPEKLIAQVAALTEPSATRGGHFSRAPPPSHS
jgi:hypothetical protein